MVVMLVMVVKRMTMMKMRRWAVIKWAARASSEQGATSMTEVKEQYDYLDNIEEQFYYLDNTLKTSLHSETIQYHPKPFISISDVSSLNKPSTEMLKCSDGYSTVVLPVDSMDGMEHRLGWAG